MAGETASALADVFDVNRATIFAILQRAGIKSRYRILTDGDVAAATAMYQAGKSLASTAKHFDVADRTVLNAFRRFGVPTWARGRTSGASQLHRQRHDDLSDPFRIGIGLQVSLQSESTTAIIGLRRVRDDESSGLVDLS